MGYRDVVTRKIEIVAITSGEISSKPNTWPIYNIDYYKWAKFAKLSFSRVYIFKSQPNLTKLHHTFIKKMAENTYWNKKCPL